MFVPANLKLDFLPECEGCDQFSLRDDVIVTGYCEQITIVTCEHLCACRRTIMHCKECENKE